MKHYDEIGIFGCGGVGSWIANFIIRNNLSRKLYAIDFDTVEEKNLRRQDYVKGDVGSYKVDGIASYTELYQTNDDPRERCEVLPFTRKIRSPIDLAGFNRNMRVVVCTDNIVSKRMIAEYFRRKLIVNCDLNYVEVKNYVEASDISAWDLGGGYSNNQDIISNIFAATYAFFILSKYDWDYGRNRIFKQKIEDIMKRNFKAANDE